MTRDEAILAGETRYDGALCSKHPELLGVRRVIGRICIQCARDYHKKYKNNDHKRIMEYRKNADVKSKVKTPE